MFRLKILGHRKAAGTKVAVVRDGLIQKTYKIGTEYNGEMRIREDIFDAYSKHARTGLTEAEMQSVMLHEKYHQKSFLARPYLWIWMGNVRKFMLLAWLIVFVATILMLLQIQTEIKMIAGAVIIISSLALMLLGLKLHTWISREQEAAADAYEAMKVNKPKVTKAFKDSLYRKGLVSQKRQYIAEHGTLKERKAWIDSVTHE